MAVNVTPPLETASSREIFAFHRAVATKLNRVIEVDETSSAASTLTIWSDELPTNCVAFLDVVVLGEATGTTSYGAYERRAKFSRGTGAATLHSASTIGTDLDPAGWDVDVGTAGDPDGVIYIDVNGAAADTVRWSAYIRILIKAA